MGGLDAWSLSFKSLFKVMIPASSLNTEHAKVLLTPFLKSGLDPGWVCFRDKIDQIIRFADPILKNIRCIPVAICEFRLVSTTCTEK